ncbi:MAG: CHAT domain-containing protein, partial [Chloroflexi bacterium]|nr:CHAT domain-containing protein [Chloroflexota bacterium]
FPGALLPQTEKPLIVQLTLQAPTAQIEEKFSLNFADSRKHELIEVVVTAPGFQERTHNWRRLLTVYYHSDSQPAVFLLTPGQTLGSQALTVDFYHHGRMVGSAALTTEVATQATMTAAPFQVEPKAGPLADLPAAPPPPADLELRVVFNRQTNELYFTLHSENPALGYQRRPMGFTPLNQKPRQFLQNIFEKLSQYARLPGVAPTDDPATPESSRHIRLVTDAQQTSTLLARYAAITEEIETIGQDLFAKVFSPELQREYWRLQTLREQGRLRSLLVISDEPWIPWELVKPYFFDQDTKQEYSDDYLAVAFAFVRWLAGRGASSQVTVKAARLVLPDANLAATVREQALFTQLATKGVMIGQPLRTRVEVLQATKEGNIELLHLAAHAGFSPENADESPIILQNQEKLLPSDLAGARSIGFRRVRPLVFLNACHTSQAEFTLTGLGGWVERMIGDISVGAFIGSLWEVNDGLAAEFAIQFYDNLLAGQTFGEAFHAARLVIRKQQPANPTWLAYTLYADPNGRMNLCK